MPIRLLKPVARDRQLELFSNLGSSRDLSQSSKLPRDCRRQKRDVPDDQSSLFDASDLIAQQWLPKFRQLCPPKIEEFGPETQVVIERAIMKALKDAAPGPKFEPIHESNVHVLAPTTIHKLLNRDFGDLCRHSEYLVGIADRLKGNGFCSLGEVVTRSPDELGLSRREATAVEDWLSRQELRLQFGMVAPGWKQPVRSAFVEALVL